MSALGWVAAALAAVAGAPGFAGSPAFAVRAHEMAPPSVAPGASSREVLTLWAPDGVRLTVYDDAPGDEDVERLGSWAPTRTPDPAGGVIWRFERPTTAWTPGSHATPALRVSAAWTRADGQADAQELAVAGVALAVVSPLPGDVRRLAPAPPEEPPPPRPYWPAVWTVIPLALATGSGLAWRRSRGHAPPVAAPDAPAAAPVPSLADVLARPSAEPGEHAVRVARAVRAQARLVARGVRAAHTTSEVLARCGEEIDGLDALLRLADAWLYGAVAPAREDVDAAAARVVEALGRG